jgi:hypothetical protein
MELIPGTNMNGGRSGREGNCLEMVDKKVNNFLGRAVTHKKWPQMSTDKTRRRMAADEWDERR